MRKMRRRLSLKKASLFRKKLRKKHKIKLKRKNFSSFGGFYLT